MAETVQNGRVVVCGRCRRLEVSRIEGGRFDSDTALTFHCESCDAQFAVCRVCGWYIADGKTCAMDHEQMQLADPGPTPAMKEDIPMLPNGIDPNTLVRDPAKRAGHWYDPQGDQVFNMGPDWRPPNAKPANGVKIKPAPIDDLTGKRLIVTVGTFTGKKGMISQVGVPADGDNFAVRAIMDGNGQELPLSADAYRLLSAEEVAADEAALKAANGGK